MIRFVRTRCIAILLSAALAAGLSACSPRTNNNGHLHVVVPTIATAWTLPFMAQDTGAFKRHGLQVDITVAGSGPLAVQAVMAGNGDVGLDVLNLTLEAAAKGQDLVNLGKVFSQWDGQLVVSSKVDAERHISAQPSQRARVQALKGLTLAVVGPATGDDILLRSLLTDAGLQPDRDVRITPIKDQQGTVSALGNGRIDGFMRASPVPQFAIYRKVGVPIVDFSKFDAKGLYAGVVFARRGQLARDRDRLNRFVAALNEAAKYVRQHRADAARLLKSHYQNLPQPVFDAAFQSAARLSTPRVERVSEVDFRENLRFVQTENAASKLEYGRVVDDSLL